MEDALWTLSMVLLIVALAAPVLLYFRFSERRRTRTLSAAARQLGFEFAAAGDQLLLQQLQRFHLFSLGWQELPRNLLRRRTPNLEVLIFDHCYSVGQDRWRLSVVCLQAKGLQLPQFCLRPERVWDKVGEWFGAQDIDFPARPGFSAQHVLRGADEAAVRQLFTEPVLGFYGDKPDLSTEGAGPWLVCYRHATRYGPKAMRARLEEALELLRLLHPPAREWQV